MRRARIREEINYLGDTYSIPNTVYTVLSHMVFISSSLQLSTFR